MESIEGPTEDKKNGRLIRGLFDHLNGDWRPFLKVNLAFGKGFVAYFSGVA